MKQEESFSDSLYTEQEHLAERELSAFVAAVKELFGPEQAELSTEDWLEESDLIDSPPISISRDWRSVTIAASARLANRLNLLHQQIVTERAELHGLSTLSPTPQIDWGKNLGQIRVT